MPLFSLQLEYRDGRWNVAELQLPVPPARGDVLHLSGDQPWEVCGCRDVPARPAGKAARRFFVCRQPA